MSDRLLRARTAARAAPRRPPSGCCEVHIVGRHERQLVIMGQADESVVEIGVGRQSMIDQLDHNMIMAEQCRQPIQLGRRRCRDRK